MRVARSNWRGDAVAVFFYVIYNVETDRQAVAVDEYRRAQYPSPLLSDPTTGTTLQCESILFM